MYVCMYACMYEVYQLEHIGVHVQMIMNVIVMLHTYYSFAGGSLYGYHSLARRYVRYICKYIHTYIRIQYKQEIFTPILTNLLLSCMYVCIGLGTKIAARLESSQGSIHLPSCVYCYSSYVCMYVCMYVCRIHALHWTRLRFFPSEIGCASKRVCFHLRIR